MKSTKRAIIICWVMLVACFIVKLFGGNWFEIVCTNEHFAHFCDYIDKNIIIKYIIALPLYVFGTYFIIVSCCLLPKPSKKQSIIIFSSIVFVWITQFLSMEIKTIIEIIMFLTIPFITKMIQENKKDWKIVVKETWYLGIIGYALDLSFQLLSLITKNLGVKILDDKMLVSLIFMIDYYIMIVLYYLYIKQRKE